MRDSTKSCQGHQNVATVIRQVTKRNEYILYNLQHEVKKLYIFGLDLFRLVQSEDNNLIPLHIYICEDPYYIKLQDKFKRSRLISYKMSWILSCSQTGDQLQETFEHVYLVYYLSLETSEAL